METSIIEFGRKAILVVDDEDHIRNVVARVLKDEGYDVVDAANGNEALFQISQIRIDAVILDIRMPGMSGLEVLHKISRDYPDIKVIMLTGNADREAVSTAKAAGVTDFLAKPVKLDRLIETVRKAVERQVEFDTTEEDRTSTEPKGGKVLVVDDEDHIRNVIARALRGEEYDISCAINGEDALQQISQQLFDTVLLDVRMPGINGFEVLNKIKIDHPDTNVIMLTGNADAESVQKAIAGGAFAYLSKPVKLDKLIATVAQACAKKSEEDDYVKEKIYSGGKKILVVDDEQHIRENMCRALAEEGYEVIGAIDGEEAIIRVNQSPFDLVLLDFMMPGTNGLEVLRQLRTIRPEAIVIMLTGAADREGRIQVTAMRDGAYSFLSKPVTLQELISTVEEAFKQEIVYWDEVESSKQRPDHWEPFEDDKAKV
ncbi:MAG: response regulator [Chloroflexota bacterium]|nr:response regulator [Chloroflexota bacterium]